MSQFLQIAGLDTYLATSPYAYHDARAELVERLDGRIQNSSLEGVLFRPEEAVPGIADLRLDRLPPALPMLPFVETLVHRPDQVLIGRDFVVENHARNPLMSPRFTFIAGEPLTMMHRSK